MSSVLKSYPPLFRAQLTFSCTTWQMHDLVLYWSCGRRSLADAIYATQEISCLNMLLHMQTREPSSEFVNLILQKDGH